MAALVLLLCSLATSLLILILKSRALDEAQQRAQGRQQLRRGPNGHIATSSAGSAARLQVRGGLFLLCGHLTALLLRSDSSRLMEPAGLAGEAAVPLILGLLLVALPALLPAAFERHRTALVGAARVAVFMASDVRNPRGLLFIFQARLCGCKYVCAGGNVPAARLAYRVQLAPPQPCPCLAADIIAPSGRPARPVWGAAGRRAGGSRTLPP